MLERLRGENCREGIVMFNATISDAKLWKNLLTAVSTLIEEADFNATPDGIKLRAMDPSHVAMVDFEWPKTAFEEYVCATQMKIRVNISEMLKLLRRVRSDETLKIVYDEKTKKLNLTLKNKITRKFVMPTLETTEEEVPTPKITFNSKIKLTTESLKDIIEDSQAISDNIRLEANPEKFTIMAVGELSSATIELDKESPALLELDVKELSKATFNLNYLAEIVKAGAMTSEVVTAEFSTNMPVKLEFELPRQGHLIYYLAPRIEAE
jgi:proliferating cell nuclear antigen